MQLTDIQKLTKDYTSNDVTEIVAVMQSTLLSSPSAELRFKNVKPSDTQAWMRDGCVSSFEEEFQIARISNMPDHTQIPCTSYAEHLVVRDLDMEHIEAEGSKDMPGRIVAHADYRFTPSSSSQPDTLGSGMNSTDASAKLPAGLNKELHLLINSSVEFGIAKLFGGLPCFTLYGISTLTPSHLRRGIAKRLVQWIYPYADHLALPVVLAASPSGLHLYRSCGFVEYRKHDVVVELGKWGSPEIHRHVMMVRWPQDDERLPACWREWRDKHSQGSLD